MNDKRTNENGRRLRYRRRLRGENKAVSPVVATLILILIAVAAAAALYLWLVAWQGGVTKGIGSPGAQYTVTIGGSTSVYPFSEVAIAQFEANNSDVVVSNNQGGTGAGMAAVCSGQVDIGAASSPQSLTTLQTADGCPATVTEQIVAYDGVDVAVPTANVHGLQNISWDTAQAIYVAASTTTSSITGSNLYVFGNFHENGFVAPVQPAAGTTGKAYEWQQIPACTAYGTQCMGSSGVAETLATSAEVTGDSNTAAGTVSTGTVPVGVTAETATVPYPIATGGAINTGAGSDFAQTAFAPACAGCGAGSAATNVVETGYAFASGVETITYSFTWTAVTTGGTLTFPIGDGTITYTNTASEANGVGTAAADVTPCSANANDICGTAGAVTPCGWTVCAGGTAASPATDYIYTVARSEVSGTTQSFLARLLAIGASGGTPSGIGFTGCSGDNQFDGCGLTNAHTAAGNPNVISAVAGNPDAIGYASDGLVQASGSGVIPINFQGYGQSQPVVIVGESTALKAIASGIAAGTSGTYGAQSYVGWRPFIYVETAPPTGEVLRYIQFVMDPGNNVNFAAESAEISIYASGLAGVVPITPIA